MKAHIFFILTYVGLISCYNGGRNDRGNRLNTTSTIKTTTKPTPELIPGKHRIVGGVETKRNEYPFIVSLADTQHFCGGSIIDREWVVTAAHCLGTGIKDFDITAGEHDLRISEGTEQIVKPVKFFRHPSYNPVTYEDDIALVKVKPPFNFTSHVKPFTLPQTRYVASGDVVTAGWGVTTEGSQDVSPVLRKVTISIIPNMDCNSQYGKDFHSHKMICAGQEGGGKDACQGDSGGPLLCSDYNDGALLCGIVSFGFGCARPEFSGVYTKVAHYADWIDWEKAKDQNPDTKFVWTTHNPNVANTTNPAPTQKRPAYQHRSTKRPRKGAATTVSSNLTAVIVVLTAMLVIFN